MDMKPVLEVCDISKNFGGVKALSSVSLDIQKGECLALVGENGAGKTTLINILNGALSPDSGFFLFDGKKYERMTPSLSIEMGVNVIHQEVALVESLTVKENIFLSNLHGSGKYFVKSSEELYTQAITILDKLGCPIDPDELVENLSTSKKQVVEIAKALSSNPTLLIMDEPTAALTQGEAEKLFEIIKQLNKEGISIVFVSHRLDEVMEISDRISVIRDGGFIGTVEKQKTSIPEIIHMMVGRDVEFLPFQGDSSDKKEILLEVRNFSYPDFFYDASFYARRGEILGFAGLVGAGRSELMQSIFGFLPHTKGQLKYKNAWIDIHSPIEAINYGIGLLPEDRKVAAAISTMNVRENLSLAALKNIKKGPFVNFKKENEMADEQIRNLRVKTAGKEDSIMNLSGGNQQKVMLARWLASDIDLLIVDEPTQGVDVGAKSEIHRLLRDYANKGAAVIIVSSDLPEVLCLSDRIHVMRNGSIVGEISSSQASPEEIMTLATLGEEC